MKTIYDEATRKELIERISRISELSQPEWGNMTAYQMVKHCSQWEEMILGIKSYKRAFLGRLFGRIALRDLIKDDTPMRRNMPTVQGFKITETGDVVAEKGKWIKLLEEHARSSKPDFLHPFFGKMTKEQTGHLDYKHIDHHLRQFSV